MKPTNPYPRPHALAPACALALALAASAASAQQFAIDGSVGLDPDGTVVGHLVVTQDGTPTDLPVDFDISVIRFPDVLPDPPPLLDGLTAEFYPGNSTSGDAAHNKFANEMPTVSWLAPQAAYGGSNGTFDAFGIPRYAPELVERHPPGDAQREDDGSLTDYTFRVTGEIFIPEPGIYNFKEGNDDFAYLEIDGAVIIENNDWNGANGTGNNGSPISPADFTGIDPGGQWLAFEFIHGEGILGDSAILFWDYDADNGGLGANTAFPADQDSPAGGGAIVPPEQFRTRATDRRFLAEDVGDLSGTGPVGAAGAQEAFTGGGVALTIAEEAGFTYEVKLEASSADAGDATFIFTTVPELDVAVGFDDDGNVVGRAVLTKRGFALDTPVSWSVEVSRQPKTLPDPAPQVEGLTFEHYQGFANPGNLGEIRNITDGNDPSLPAFVYPHGAAWGGSDGTFDGAGVPRYPDPVENRFPRGDPAREGNGSLINYISVLSGEIFIPEPGTYNFKDGADDFTYLEIDGQVLIEDNDWTNAAGTRGAGNPGEGSPIVEADFSGLAAGGEWLPIEFIVGEGNGGDSGMLFWDYDPAAAAGARVGTNPDFPAEIDEDAGAAAIIPGSNYRTVAQGPADLTELLGALDGTAPVGGPGTDAVFSSDGGATLNFALDPDFFYTVEVTATAEGTAPASASFTTLPIPTFEASASIDPDTGEVVGAIYVGLDGEPTDEPVSWSLSVVRQPLNLPDPAPSTPGALFQHYQGSGNLGDIGSFRDYWADNPPTVETIVDALGWGGLATSGAFPGTPSYYGAVQAALGPGLTGGQLDNFSTRSSGEIFIPESGTYRFKDGTDDFSYFAIDGQLVLSDNDWSNNDGTRVDGGVMMGSPIGEIEFDVPAGGQWFPFEFVTGEGGGGDRGNLFWDYDPNAPEGMRLNANAGFPPDENTAATAEALLRSTHLRVPATSPTQINLPSGELSGTGPFGGPARPAPLADDAGGTLTLPKAEDDFFYIMTFTASAPGFEPVTLTTSSNRDRHQVYRIGEQELLEGNLLQANPGATIQSSVLEGVQGELTINPDGTFTYDPRTALNHLQNGEAVTERFTFRTEDSAVSSNGGRVTVVVSGFSDPPVTNPDSFILAKDANLVVRLNFLTANDTDPDSANIPIASVDPGDFLGTMDPALSPGVQGRFYDLAGTGGPALLTTDATGHFPLLDLAPNFGQVVTLVDFGGGTENVPSDGFVADRGGTQENPFGGIGVDVGINNFAALFTGFITFPEDGMWAIWNRSDDGSVTWVDFNGDGVLDNADIVVDDNSNHGMRWWGSAQDTANFRQVDAGRYAFRTAFYEAGQGAGFQLAWEKGGDNAIARQTIPASAFSYTDPSTVLIDTAGAYDGLGPDDEVQANATYTVRDERSGEEVLGQITITIVGGEVPDSDDDGLNDQEELALGTDINNPDTDGDGLLDGVETDTGTYVDAADTGTDPLDPDTDGDGLLDGVEDDSGVFTDAASPGTDPHDPDSDADGYADGFEALSGFNPLDDQSFNNVSNLLAGGTFTVVHSSALPPQTVGNLTSAKGLTEGNLAAEDITTVQRPFINMADGALALFAASAQAYPLWEGEDPAGGDRHDDFAIKVTGSFFFQIGGPVVIVVNSDDGFELTVDGVVLGTAGNRGRADSVMMADLAAGGHELVLYHNERAGGAGINLLVGLGVGPAGPTNETHYELLQAAPSPFEHRVGDDDGDGMDDYFERFFFAGSLDRDGSGDLDGDGLSDLEEFNAGADPRRTDTDGDGLPDGDEVNLHGTNPALADSDDDGLTDPEELNRVPPTNPTDADSDDDTFVDGIEVALGTDPLDPDDHPPLGTIFQVRDARPGEGWDTPGLWSDGQAPHPGGAYLVDAGTALVLRSPAGDAPVFGGDSLTLGPGTTLKLGHGAGTTAEVNLGLGEGTTVENDGAARGLGGTVTVSGSPAFDVDGGDLDLSAAISGTGLIRVVGNDSVFLDLSRAGNAYRGDWLVDGGGLRVSAAGALGNFGDLELEHGTIDDAADIDVGAAGTFTINIPNAPTFLLNSDHRVADLIAVTDRGAGLEELSLVSLGLTDTYDAAFLNQGVGFGEVFGPAGGGSITVTGGEVSPDLDSDGDGIPDAVEAQIGTDPANPLSTFAVRERPAATIGAGGALEAFAFTVPGGAGATFNIEFKADLNAPTWTVIGTLSGGETFTDSDAARLAGATGYYRVRLAP